MSFRKRLPGIYKVTCTANGRCYIGQSNDCPMRWAQHMADLFPMDQVATMEYRQTGKIFKGAAGQVEIRSHPTRGRVRIKSWNDWLFHPRGGSVGVADSCTGQVSLRNGETGRPLEPNRFGGGWGKLRNA